MQCTLREIADYFNCSEDTIEHHVKEHYKVGFSEIFRRKRQRGLMSLRANMFQLSKKDGKVAIFLAKNWLGMADKQETTIVGDTNRPVVIKGVNPETKKLIGEVLRGEGTERGPADNADIR